MSGAELGPCPLCGRSMIEGPSLNRHHLVPRTFGGKEAVWMHRICHGKIHSVLTERELYAHYHTIERLLAHEEIDKFVRWVRRKDPEYVDGNVTARAKGRR